ncbi:MAG TPA: alpha-amylase family protein, partial [Anaerolineae bacterium]|nr:alpha-amylase family protein [Anaerolineae bacterium]
KKWKVDQYNINSAGDDDQGDGLITVIPAGDPRPAPAGGVFVHLFEWRWADIEKECAYLAQKGYSAVQVSPPNEHLVPTADQGGGANNDFPWWVRYQPVTHDTSKFTSRSGTWAEFQSMVNACDALGVGIYVDAVINHMADIEVGNPPAGTHGTQYQSNPAASRFYGTQYQSTDFHAPDCTIGNYADRRQVQECKLSGLPDLNTGKDDVQDELRGYLQALINAGVKGFRIDGAKHMAAQDIAAIFDGLTGSFYIFQEVIDQSSNERVRDWEYTPNGDVTEFAYAFALGAAFDDACSGSLSDLESRFDDADMLASRFAQVFSDNHDNQRGHGVGSGCVVDHRDGQEHVLANVFALAYPYGYPSVMSSYYWQSSSTDNTGDSMGPPSSSDGGITWGVGRDAVTRPVYGAGQVAGDVPANCSATFEDGKWVCEHRRTATANMVKFRQATAGQPVVHWQNVGGSTTDHIAFGLGNKGFVAINRTASAATTTYQTGLLAGNYCDIVHYDYDSGTGDCLLPNSAIRAPANGLITVNASGQIVNQTLGAMDAFAIYSGAGPLAVTLASFEATQQGEAVLVSWETVSELNNRGFNLYRGVSPAAPDRQLNSSLIPSQSQGNPMGFVYTWEDRLDLVAGQTYWYWLEDVDLNGATTLHGPVSATFQTPTAITLAGLEAGAAPAAAPGLPLWSVLLAATVSVALAARRRAQAR